MDHMKAYEELAKKIAEAQKAGNLQLAQEHLQCGSEALAKKLGRGYFETKEMVVFCLKGIA
jgi:hypothetical protein